MAGRLLKESHKIYAEHLKDMKEFMATNLNIKEYFENDVQMNMKQCLQDYMNKEKNYK